MNDRYLYRAKRKNCRGLTKEMWWVEGYLYGIWERRYILWGMTNDVPNMVEVDPSTICQCTGLMDKNGKLIYEENIVRYEEGSVGIVEFGVWNYYCRGFYIRWLSGNAKCYRNELGYWAPKVEIIGSAFDNLELLEVGE